MNAVSKFFATFSLVALLAGCSLIPKQVEFFQSKVQKVPVLATADKEVQKEAADLAARKADETYKAALVEDASEAVLKPAEDTRLLTLSVSKSVGAPLNPWRDEANLLSAKLDHVEAKLNQRLDKFAEKQDENAGRKIEGSGAFSVPWIVYVFGVAIFFVVSYVVLKVILTFASISNPEVAIGTRVASLGAKGVAKGFSQLIRGGENFKDDVKKLFGESDATAKTILELFKKHQTAAQDQDIQHVVAQLTK